MSTWGWKHSEEPLFGALKNSDRLSWGGDVRWVQTAIDTPDLRTGEFFPMQQNIELAYHVAKVWFVGTLGLRQGPKSTEDQGTFLSERHYILWSPLDTLFVRVGKFRINYGINDPDHTRVTKNDLGFGDLTETYNLEVSKFTDNYEFFITTSLGRPDLNETQTGEKSLSLSAASYIGHKSKAGVSALVGDSASQKRMLGGIWGILTPFEKSTVVGELDYQETSANDSHTKTRGYYFDTRWVQEVYKGIKPYILISVSQTDFRDSGSVQTAPGVGLQFMPIPHAEIQAEYQRQVSNRTPGQRTGFSFVMLHFYL